jgi:hypothetical protein
MNYIYIVGIFEALFLFAFILSKRKRSTADSVLALAFLLFGINIFTAYMEWQNRTNGYPFPFFIQTTPPFLLLHGPVLWFYIKAQTEQNFRFKAIHLLHFLPFILLLTDLLLSIYILPETAKMELDKSEGFKSFPTFNLDMMAILFSPPVYYFWGLKLLNRYQKQLKDYFSETSQVDLQWLKVLLVSSLCLAIAINGTFFIDHFVAIAPFGVLQSISYLFVSVYILFLGFFGHRQQVLITQVPLKVVVASDKQSQKPIANADEAFIYRLLE